MRNTITPSTRKIMLAAGTFQWEVNYDETITEKIAVKDPMSIAWATAYATDKKFSDDREGKRIVTGSIKHFGCEMSQDIIENWAKKNDKILARPKELIDFSKSFPCPNIDSYMPLAAAGQFCHLIGNCHCCLFLDTRILGGVWFDPSAQWDDSWYFLFLDKQ